MTTGINWPPSLKQVFEQSGFEETMRNGSIRTETDAGIKQARQVLSNPTEPMTISVALQNTTEVQTLRTFFETTLGRGTLKFDFPHPTKGVDFEVRFEGDIQISSVGSEFLAAFKLEVFDAA